MSSPFFTDEHGMSSGVRSTSEDNSCLPCKLSVSSAMIFEIRAKDSPSHATSGLRLNRCIIHVYYIAIYTLSSEGYLSIFDHATFKNYNSVVIYNSV